MLLTHRGRVTHICVGKQTIIGSDNGLASGWRQVIIWTNAKIMLIGPLGTKSDEIVIEIHTFPFKKIHLHYIDIIMTTMASQITSLTVVYSTVYSDADQRKHQSSTSLAFVWGIHRDRWIPRTKGQLRGKCFHLMTSSWKMSFGKLRPFGLGLSVLTRAGLLAPQGVVELGHHWFR